MRKSIFDIAAENTTIRDDVNRILTIVEKEDIIRADGLFNYKLFDFVDKYCFNQWEFRGHYLNVEDFLRGVNYNSLKSYASQYPDVMLGLIELIYNFWLLSKNAFFHGEVAGRIQWIGNYDHLKNIMDDILEQYNHLAYMNDDCTKVLVIESKEEVTAVAEILPTSLSLDVIKYNHRSLKGEIELKKAILLRLANELEPNRKEIKSLNAKLEDDIFFILNNLNVRHNNCNKDDKNYKEYVAGMEKERIEEWYDELYQMMLLAILLLDNAERTNKINELKTKICGG